MSMRNILVAFNGSDSSVAALKYAASLARGEGYVTALVAHAQHESFDSRARWVPDKAREIIAQANADLLAGIANRFEALQAALGLGDRLHFEQVAGRVDTVLAETARTYDLIVVGQDGVGEADDHVSIHPDRIALLSGRPVIVVPQDHDADASHTHAVLAWDASRASARALSDSLGLLEDQGRVTVLTVGENTAPRPVDDLLRHLDRHKVQAEHQPIASEPGVARALIAYCQQTDPCLLVMGAYEHSKFREDFLGGVTARVLRETPVPVLLSH